MREVLLIRRTIDENGQRGEAIADPRMPAIEDPPDAKAFWEAVFDHKRPHPPTEDPQGMLSMLKFAGGEGQFELRVMPFYFPDIRIAYGTPTVDVLEADERAAQAAKIVREKLNHRFAGAAPDFINNKAEANQITRIGYGRRVGYSFAIRRSADSVGALVARYPSTFRYREYEFLLALRDVIHALDLEPVILWNRGSFYILNLWEKQP